MSKILQSDNFGNMSEIDYTPVDDTQKLSEEEINEGFEQSLKDGTVTDVMGNPLTEDDFISVSKETSLWDTLEVIKTFQGKILTIIDATYDDRERVKYVKDLIKGQFVILGDKIIDINQDLTNCSQSNPLK